MLFDKFFFFYTFKIKFGALLHKFNFNLGGYAFYIKGFFSKPLLLKLHNRWLNLYNIFYGRAMNFYKTAVFSFTATTKNVIMKMRSKLIVRYVNNYLSTHAFTRASHFLAVANVRYSFVKSNF